MRTATLRSLRVAALATALLVAAGCGNGGKSEPAGAVRPKSSSASASAASHAPLRSWDQGSLVRAQLTPQDLTDPRLRIIGGGAPASPDPAQGTGSDCESRLGALNSPTGAIATVTTIGDPANPNDGFAQVLAVRPSAEPGWLVRNTRELLRDCPTLTATTLAGDAAPLQLAEVPVPGPLRGTTVAVKATQQHPDPATSEFSYMFVVSSDAGAEQVVYNAYSPKLPNFDDEETFLFGAAEAGLRKLR